MRLSRHWWILVAATGLLVAGCSGERSVTPASPAASDARTAHAPPFRKIRATPAPCHISDSSPIWKRTFSYVQTAVNWKVPSGVTQIDVAVEGAQGGGYGLGGCVMATVPVTSGESLRIVVGGQGTANGQGGFNGGGNGGGSCCNGANGGGGGGASDVREGGAGLANRIVVAGGGGGSSGDGWWGGTGGGPTGGDGFQSTDYPRGYGHGGTQSAGGAAAKGGTAGSLGNGGTGGSNAGSARFGGGGGGGGYYGGGGGRYSHHDGPTNLDDGDSGGGGGSGFSESKASGVVNVNGERYGNGLVTIAWAQTVTQPASGLNKPLGIAVDKDNAVYFSTADGNVMKLAPNASPAPIAKFNNPAAVAVDWNKDVYVSDLTDQAIYIIAPNGSKSTAVNQVKADGLAVDGNGTLYFTDRCGKNCGVLKMLSGGKITKLADLYNPQSLAVSPACKNSCPIYEIETYNGLFGHEYFYFYAIATVTPPKGDPYGFKTKLHLTDPSPTAVAVDAAGAGYVVDGPEKAVFKYSFGGSPLTVGSNWGYPTDVAVNPICTAICAVYVTDYQNGLIVEVR